MAKQKNILNKFEREILGLLNKSIVPISTNAIAEKLGYSYATTNKYLESLHKKKVLIKHEK